MPARHFRRVPHYGEELARRHREGDTFHRDELAVRDVAQRMHRSLLQRVHALAGDAKALADPVYDERWGF